MHCCWSEFVAALFVYSATNKYFCGRCWSVCRLDGKIHISQTMITENRNRLYVSVAVKPYCYRWLVNNFHIDGAREDCISLRRHRLLQVIFRNMLQHKTRLQFHDTQSPARWRTRTVHIALGSHDLEHHGLDLSPEGKAEFAGLVEQLCQEDFRQFFVHTYMVEPRVKMIIEQYHRLRGFSEEDWPQESMQKIVTRMGVTAQLRRERESFLQKSNALFTANLSAIMDSKTAISAI